MTEEPLAVTLNPAPNWRLHPALAPAMAVVAGVGVWLAIGPDAALAPGQWGEFSRWLPRDPFLHDPVLRDSAAGMRGGGPGGMTGYLVYRLAVVAGSPAAALRLVAAFTSALLVLGLLPMLTVCAKSPVAGAVVALAAVVARPALGDAEWGTMSTGAVAGLSLALGVALAYGAWTWRHHRLGIAMTTALGGLSWLHAPTSVALLVGVAAALAWAGRTRCLVANAAAGLGAGWAVAAPALWFARPLAHPQFAEIAREHHAAGMVPWPNGALGIALSAFAPLLLVSHLAWRARRGRGQEPIVRWLAVAVVIAAATGIAAQGVAQFGARWNEGVPLGVDFLSATRLLYLGALAYVAMGMGDFLRGELFPVAPKWRLPLVAVAGLLLLIAPETIRRSVTAAGRRSATLESARAQDLRAASAWLTLNAVRPVVATDESGFRFLAGAAVTHAEGDAVFLLRAPSPIAVQWAQRRSMWRTAWAQRPPTLAQLTLLAGVFGADYAYIPVLLAPDDARTVWRGQERALVTVSK